jgi:hypothetical protein
MDTYTAAEEDIQFFYQHAGWGYDPDTETPEEGRRRSAISLAKAEAWAKDNEVTYKWEDDWNLLSHVDEYPDAYDEEPSTCEICVIYDKAGRVLNVVGCVDDADDNYRRVTEAELAYESFDNL